MRILKHIAILIIIGALFTSCSPDLFSKEGTAYVLSVALDYQNSPVSDLIGTVDDAIEFTECLKSNYVYRGIPIATTYMLQEGEYQNRNYDTYPSADNILSMISSIRPSKNDIFIFYYSGHGAVDEEGKAYFAAGAEREGELFTYLYMDDVRDALDSLPCQSVAIIDACYSGNMKPEDSASEISTAFLNAVKGLDLRKTVVLAACQRDTLSYVTTIYNEEGESERHSVLTVELLSSMGWRHTSSTRIWAESSGKMIEAYGTLGYFAGPLNLFELYDSIIAGWTRPDQIPVINNPGLDIYLIPES